jgi:DNA-binding NtrC family response regulator
VIEKQEAEEKDAGSSNDHSLRKWKILIIDDDPDITALFRKALMNDGFEDVEAANDPRLVLKNFKVGSYDLLIIDVVMPQMDGFSLYEEMKKIDSKVKVCFITAFGINYRALFTAATTILPNIIWYNCLKI